MSIASAPGTEGRARWSVRLFGGFELSTLPAGDKVAGLGKRERVLLAYLALNPRGREQRRKLTTLLWGDAADETTLENLRSCLYGVRKTLGDSEHRVIASDGEDIVLDAAAFEVDALAFRRLAAQLGRAELEQAARLYTGELLDGLDIESEEFESWHRTEAARFRNQTVDVLSRLLAQLSETGETDRAIETAEQVLKLDPLKEVAVRRLMQLLTGTGRRSAAIQLYRTLSDALKAELDAQPEAETRAVFAEITRGGEETRAPAARPAAPASVLLRSGAPLQPLRPQAGRLGPVIGALRQARAIKRNWIIAGGLAAAAGAMLLFIPFVPSEGPTSTTGPATVVAATPASTIALAVLPFANLSTEPDQEFFSDGLTDEIISALAKVRALRIVARTSAFEFKGQNRNIRTIGEQLGATHLIEGTVRRAGDRVRITVQLIRAEDGTEIWSDAYDRELTDIFAIQEEVATAIAGALRMPLGLDTNNTLVFNRSIDPESYQQFLRARPLVRARAAGAQQAGEILVPLLARNPDYAPAWALLAAAYMNVRGGPRLLEQAEAAARRAIQLDPNLADAYFVLARLERVRGRPVAAEDLLSKALALDPNNPEVLDQRMLLLANMGWQKEALAAAQQLVALEPYVPAWNSDVGEILWVNGQNAAAIEKLKSASDRPSQPISLAMIYASMGRYIEAAETLEAAVRSRSNMSQEGVAWFRKNAGLLRAAPAKAASPQSLPDCCFSFVYLHVGAPERVLEDYEATVESGVIGGAGGDVGRLWHPSFAPVRKLERFKVFVRKSGMVDYWRAKGWPELCRPVGADDFVCD